MPLGWVAPKCRSELTPQCSSDASLVTFGACFRHASTYQLFPVRSRRTSFHASSPRQ
jgi:hypothetical protein